MIDFFLDYKIIGFDNGFYYIHGDDRITEHKINIPALIDGKTYLYDGNAVLENGVKPTGYKDSYYYDSAFYISPYQKFDFDEHGVLKKFEGYDSEGKKVWTAVKYDNIIEIYYDKYYFKDGLMYFYNYSKPANGAEDTPEFRPSIYNLGRYDIIKPSRTTKYQKPQQKLNTVPKRRTTLLAQKQLYGNCYAHSVARSISKLIKSYSIKHNFGPLIDTGTTVDDCDQKHIESENPDTYNNMLSNEKCINNPSRNYALLYSYILKLVEYYFGIYGGVTQLIFDLFSIYFNDIVNCKRKKDILTPNLDLESVKMLNDFTDKLVEDKENKEYLSFKYVNNEDNYNSDYNWIIDPQNKGDENDILSIKDLIRRDKIYCSIGIYTNSIQRTRFELIAFLQKRNIHINDDDIVNMSDQKLNDIAKYYKINIEDKTLNHESIITDWDDENGITILNTAGYDWGNRGKIVIKNHKLLGNTVIFSFLFISSVKYRGSQQCILLKHQIEKKNELMASRSPNPLQLEKITNGITLFVNEKYGIYAKLKKDKMFFDCIFESDPELKNAKREIDENIELEPEQAETPAQVQEETPAPVQEETHALVQEETPAPVEPATSAPVKLENTNTGLNPDSTPNGKPGVLSKIFNWGSRLLSQKSPTKTKAGGKKRTIKQKHTLRKTTRKNLRRSKIKSQRTRRFLRGSSKMKRVRNSRK